jgi:hypothetical protein
MRREVGRAPFLRQMEAPRFDSVAPTRMDEAEIVAEPRRHQQPRREFLQRLGLSRVEVILGRREVLALRRIVHGVDLRRQREPLTIGGAGPEPMAVTIVDRDRRPGDRTGVLQRGHPDHRIGGALLEVDREVGDQRGGRNVHRGIFAQQRATQERAFQFHDIEAGLAQRDADNLERLGAVGLRHREGFRRAVRGAIREDRARALSARYLPKPREYGRRRGHRKSEDPRVDSAQKIA